MSGIPGLGGADALVAAMSLLLSAIGLSTASGLRAYVPLLAVALGSHVPTPHGGHLVSLTITFHFMGSVQFIAAMAVLALLDFIIDKIPFLVHVSDLLHTVIRPAAGALVMAGTINALSQQNVVLAGVVGAALALAVHSTKAASRTGVTAATAGLGNPVVSLGEDVVAVLLTILSVLAPFLALVFLLLVGALVAPFVIRGARWYARNRRSVSGSGTPAGARRRAAN